MGSGRSKPPRISSRVTPISMTATCLRRRMLPKRWSTTLVSQLMLVLGCAEPRPRPAAESSIRVCTQSQHSGCDQPPHIDIRVAMDASAPSHWGYLASEGPPPPPDSGYGRCCDPGDYMRCMQHYRDSLLGQGVRADRAESMAHISCRVSCRYAPLGILVDASCLALPDVNFP